MTVPVVARRRRPRTWLAAAIAALIVLASCVPAAPPPPSSPASLPASLPASPPSSPSEPNASPSGSGATGHYDIVVANVNGGTHKGAGEHVGDGQVVCARLAGGDWVAYGVYFPNDPAFPGRDIADFHIVSTPGNQTVEMTLMDHTTDNPFDWSVMKAFEGRFSFTTNDQVNPWIISATGDDKSQHITISATCSVMEGP
jgi:hypothetical protein